MAFENFNAHILEPLDIGILTDIRPLNVIPKIMHNFCNTGHSNTANTHKMDTTNGVRVRWHFIKLRHAASPDIFIPFV